MLVVYGNDNFDGEDNKQRCKVFFNTYIIIKEKRTFMDYIARHWKMVGHDQNVDQLIQTDLYSLTTSHVYI